MSILSKLVRKAAKFAIKKAAPVVGSIIGGPVGGLVAGGIAATVAGGSRPRTPTVQLPEYNPPGIQLPGNMTLNLPGFGPPGFGIEGTGPRQGRVAASNGQCPKGYHLDKRTRSYCVRNRRTNYANGRAAQRAGRRLRGTVKMLRKSFALVGGSVPKGKKFVPKRK